MACPGPRFHVQKPEAWSRLVVGNWGWWGLWQSAQVPVTTGLWEEGLNITTSSDFTEKLIGSLECVCVCVEEILQFLNIDQISSLFLNTLHMNTHSRQSSPRGPILGGLQEPLQPT